MDRRDFVVKTAVGIAAVGAAGLAQAGSHEHHGGHAGHHGGGASHGKLRALRASAADCDSAAADCTRHCIELLGGGDTSLADCLSSVRRMQPVIVAMAAVAASETKPSKRTRELAVVCAGFCRDCEAECKPHAKKHASCQACLEACVACAKACDALAA